MAHHRVIGSANRLPWGHLPAAMDWFKENAMSKPTSMKVCSEVVVIGGDSIYEQCLPNADRLYLTFIDADLSGATRFPLWGHIHFQETFVGHQLANEDNEFDMKFVILDKETSHANVAEAN